MPDDSPRNGKSWVMGAETLPGKNLIHKIFRELKEYVVLSLYLYVCFSAILLYTAAVLRGHGIDYEPYGFALIKALILGKFMLIGNSLNIGRIFKYKPLFYFIVFRSFSYFGFLILLSLIEEVVVGLVHGRSAADTLSGIAGGTGLQIFATCVLLWLILIPVVTVQEVVGMLGKDQLHRIFFVADR